MKTLQLKSVTFCSVCLLFLSVGAWAELRMPSIFGDHMVIQAGHEIQVWGWADAGAEVTVSLSKRMTTTRAGESGRWSVGLRALKDAGPHRLVVSSNGESLTFDDVLVGEVWLCSGQSNMQWPVSLSDNAEKEIASANYPSMRLFTVSQRTALSPADDVEGHWEICTPESVAEFSAVGYYFGRELHARDNVPVGLIDSSWGGTPVEAWMSAEALQSVESRRPMVEQWDEHVSNYDEKLQAHEERVARAKEEGADEPEAPWGPMHHHRPSSLYNAMIAPLAPYGIQGAIWYQGESNASRAYQYRDLFSGMIADWRDQWSQGKFSFLFVQLANFRSRPAKPAESDWAELREAQSMALSRRTTGMAVTIDIGNRNDIHPRNKQDVGRRLAAAAQKTAYGQRGFSRSGPVYRSASIKGKEVHIWFRDANGGVVKHGGGPMRGFAIAGADGQFVWGDAHIEGGKVIVTSVEIDEPVAVRYGWADDPRCMLFDGAGFPVSPFRTDDWPGVTVDRNLVF